MSDEAQSPRISVGFRLAERFDPECGESWPKYVAWSGLAHLEEVVGLDCVLCPCPLTQLTAEDWEHVVFAEHLFGCFDDSAYALSRAGADLTIDRIQLLALAREPVEHEVPTLNVPGFRFMGFDLMDEQTAISALTNCGGFDGAFEASDLTPKGLVSTASRAYEIRAALAELYPEESHAVCAVWAIWRREADSGGDKH
jgi:hypothetical protein